MLERTSTDYNGRQTNQGNNKSNHANIDMTSRKAIWIQNTINQK